MRKVLIANRGEIAVRLIRACRAAGLATVAIYSEADAETLHARLADESICIGPGPAHLSYLKKEAIFSVCEALGVDAIHPGYGFFSESASFARICEESNIIFIGPSSASITQLGDKANARLLAHTLGIPVPQGSAPLKEVEEALQVAEIMGYPFMLKAVAGGGGKGIRCIATPQELREQFPQAQKESIASFGVGDLYLEQKIVQARHIEIQVLGSPESGYAWFCERDCTAQRRRQKVIEESPSPFIDAALRMQLGGAAVALAKAANYRSLVTCEFLVDTEGRYFFIEANTRVQVEHTVTEDITGIDLVVLQLQLAQGKKLEERGYIPPKNGASIQVRVCAEDAARNFAPQPGKIVRFIPPGGIGIRVETGMASGCCFPPFYDSLFAKVIATGGSREEARYRLLHAMQEMCVEGITTTQDYLASLLTSRSFINGHYSVETIDTLGTLP